MGCRDLLVGQVLILDRSTHRKCSLHSLASQFFTHQIKGRSWAAGRKQGRAPHVGQSRQGWPEIGRWTIVSGTISSFWAPVGVIFRLTLDVTELL